MDSFYYCKWIWIDLFDYSWVIELKDNDCPFCSKSFQSGNDWVKHLQKIHNASPTDAYGYMNDKGYFFRDCIK